MSVIIWNEYEQEQIVIHGSSKPGDPCIIIPDHEAHKWLAALAEAIYDIEGEAIEAPGKFSTIREE